MTTTRGVTIIISMDIIFFFGFQKENLFDVLKKEFISG